MAFGRRGVEPRDNRRQQRIPITLRGRFMRDGLARDIPCEAVNISGGGMFVKSGVSPLIGERIVLYIDNLGRFEARVARASRDGFGVILRLTPRLRIRLDTQMIWLSKLASKAVKELRSYDRIIPRRRVASITTSSGLARAVQIIDLSRGGVSLAGPLPFCIGERVTVGATPARIVAITRERVAAQFAAPVAMEIFSENYQP